MTWDRRPRRSTTRINEAPAAPLAGPTAETGATRRAWASTGIFHGSLSNLGGNRVKAVRGTSKPGCACLSNQVRVPSASTAGTAGHNCSNPWGRTELLRQHRSPSRPAPSSSSLLTVDPVGASGLRGTFTEGKDQDHTWWKRFRVLGQYIHLWGYSVALST